MEFILQDEDNVFIKKIKVNTIEELREIQKEYGNYELVINFNDWGDWGNGVEDCPSITVY